MLCGCVFGKNFTIVEASDSIDHLLDSVEFRKGQIAIIEQHHSRLLVTVESTFSIGRTLCQQQLEYIGPGLVQQTTNWILPHYVRCEKLEIVDRRIAHRAEM